MIREVLSLGLKTAAFGLIKASVFIRGQGKAELLDEEDSLVEVELPPNASPISKQAAAMIVPKKARETDTSTAPLPGSVEARLAKARGGW